MSKSPKVLESALCDPATGRIILRFRDRTSLCFAAGPAALRDLKTAIIDGYAHAGRALASTVAPARGQL